PARCALGKRIATPDSGHDPSDGIGTDAARCEVRPDANRSIHLRHNAWRRLANFFRRARSVSVADAGAFAWRRRLSLSRRTLRHHARAHGQVVTGRRGAKSAVVLRAADGL